MADLEFMRNATQRKMVRTGFASFWVQQICVMGPASLPVWLIGLVALLLSRRTRVLGIVYVAVAAFLVASGSSRPNYLAVAYAPLFAAGGHGHRPRGGPARAGPGCGRWRWRARWCCWAPLVPLGLPILPVRAHVAYMRAIGVRPPAQEHTSEGTCRRSSPTCSAGRTSRAGWRVSTTRCRPTSARSARIFTYNYGQAGAIDFFGPRYGLPPAISPHNNYWLWGPRGATGEVLIIVGGEPRRSPRGLQQRRAGRHDELPVLHALRERRADLPLQGTESYDGPTMGADPHLHLTGASRAARP